MEQIINKVEKWKNQLQMNKNNKMRLQRRKRRRLGEVQSNLLLISLHLIIQKEK